MKRFLIHVSTNWCRMDNTFRAIAESELDLYDTAGYLAYDNFQSYGCDSDIAEEEVKINTKSLLKWLLELSRLRGDIRTGHLVEAKG